MFFSLPLSILMGLEEDRQRQLERLACRRCKLGLAGPARQLSRRLLGLSATRANLSGRRRHGGLPAASLAAN
jgi:hypothetical protein